MSSAVHMSLFELRDAIDKYEPLPVSDVPVFRRIVDSKLGLVVVVCNWGTEKVAGLSKYLFEKGCDISRNDNYVHLGPWMCRVVREDEHTVWIERLNE